MTESRDAEGTGGTADGGMADVPPESTRRAGRVLVIEDEASISAYLATVLDGGGYDVVCRESALGLATLLRGWRPDVILLDLGLPYRSGVSMLADFKADPATAMIPIIVLTGAPDSLTPERASQAAAVLAKPVGMQALLDAVRAASRSSS